MTENETQTVSWRVRWPLRRILSLIFIVSLAATWGYAWLGSKGWIGVFLSRFTAASFVAAMVVIFFWRYSRTRKFLKENSLAAEANKRSRKFAFIGTGLLIASFAWELGVFAVVPRSSGFAVIGWYGMLILMGIGFLFLLYRSVAKQNIHWASILPPDRLRPDHSMVEPKYSTIAAYLRYLALFGLTILTIAATTDTKSSPLFGATVMVFAILCWPPVIAAYERGWRWARLRQGRPKYFESRALWFDLLLAASLIGGSAVMIFDKDDSKYHFNFLLMVGVPIAVATFFRLIQLRPQADLANPK